ncbi:chaplin family protein [Streptomyces sp. NPDC102406]|uniref:chaplin n=1 Tax=Streptomyces sp. NPDC102406 TaxID=3366171 RepID=UPI0037F3E233
MRQVTRKGLITVAAASGVLAVTGGYAHADAGAQGSSANSPGVGSGNSVEAPVHVPVNLCGNTVNVIGLLNPAMGNHCADTSHGTGGHRGPHKPSGGGAHADGHTSGSPGVGSGNHVEAPVDVPANACGNSVDVIGIGNPAMGNGCGNPGGHTATPPGDSEQPPSKPHDPGTPGTPSHPSTPGHPDTPGTPGSPQVRGGHFVGDEIVAGKPVDRLNRPEAQSAGSPRAEAQLAMTGSSLPIGAAIPVGAGALLAGAVLYRRARTAA